MQTTSTTQQSSLKQILSLVVLTLMLCFSQQLFAQTGQRCFETPNTGCASCQLRYPDNSNLPRSAVVFNESDVLAAADPGPATCGAAPTQIKMWYSDEHAMTLGVRRVIVKTSSGTTTTDYPLTPGTNTPTCVNNPLVGTTIQTGAQSGNDKADGGGRPLWPVLYITDLTTNGATSRIGDWQYGGTGYAPNKVCGLWKGAVRTVDSTKNPVLVTITPDADPATKNHWNLGGGEAPPAGTSDLGYGAEVAWNVADLGLLAGHTYRLQFMVHDGDQNKDGGDVGESCTTIVMPGSVPNPPVITAKSVWTSNSANQTVTIRTIIDKNFVDNTYGANAVGWPSGHAFTDLTNSDFLRMALYDANGALKMDFSMDYFSASSGAPSGYKSLGVGGGDGHMYTGSAGNVVSVRTSMDSNFNSLGYVLTTNSPATNSSYTPNPIYPAWDFNVWYEVTVKQSAFGAAGFGYPAIPDLHATPSKVGVNDVALNVVDCPDNTVKLGNLVWVDLNNDGIHQLNEPGFNGVNVNLYLDANNDNIPDSNTPIATTVTDANGNYQFSGLAPNNYIVGVTLPYNTTLVTTNGGDPDNNIINDNNGVSVVNGEARSLSITLVPGTEPTNDGDNADANETLNFALVPNEGSFGDYVWNDVNQNGKQDVNETGIPNVIVKLYTSTGTLVAITASDDLGEYTFDHVPATTAGTSYKLFFTNIPSGYTFTFKNKAGVSTDLNSDVNPGTGFTDVFVLHAGETNNDVDAGIFNPGGPLPVTLTQFTGIYKEGVSMLNWSTTQELNLASYQVERSTDGVFFNNIGSVGAKGNASTTSSYNFNDRLPVAGANYYRLKMVDANNVVHYSNVILLNVLLKGISITGIYPNPFTDKVQVSVVAETAQQVQIRVTDYVGRNIRTETFSAQQGSNNFTVSQLGALQKGLYLIEVKTATDTKTIKLMK